MKLQDSLTYPDVFWPYLWARLTRGFSILLMALLFFVLLTLALNLFEDASSFRHVRFAQEIEDAISSVVRQVIPSKIGGIDAAPWIVIVLCFFASGYLNRLSVKFYDQAEYRVFRHNVTEWKKKMHLSDRSALITPLTQKLDALKTAPKKERDQLLKEFADMKKKLDAMGRDLAFLSVDVVNSTGLKQGEERAVVEHDFREFKRFVERRLAAHGCLKSTWTPDGVMTCFTAVDAAVGAACEIIAGLDQFNREVKAMRQEFAVRCGVNSGFVYFDESVPLEEMSDRVIDIAGHFQKQAEPNTVAIAKPAIEPLLERKGFEPSGRTVDGYEVYEWRHIKEAESGNGHT